MADHSQAVGDSAQDVADMMAAIDAHLSEVEGGVRDKGLDEADVVPEDDSWMPREDVSHGEEEAAKEYSRQGDQADDDSMHARSGYGYDHGDEEEDGSFDGSFDGSLDHVDQSQLDHGVDHSHLEHSANHLDDSHLQHRDHGADHSMNGSHDETIDHHDHEHALYDTDEVSHMDLESLSHSSSRRASLRTEALIHAAARAVVASLEEGRTSLDLEERLPEMLGRKSAEGGREVTPEEDHGEDREEDHEEVHEEVHDSVHSALSVYDDHDGLEQERQDHPDHDNLVDSLHQDSLHHEDLYDDIHDHAEEHESHADVENKSLQGSLHGSLHDSHDSHDIHDIHDSLHESVYESRHSLPSHHSDGLDIHDQEIHPVDHVDTPEEDADYDDVDDDADLDDVYHHDADDVFSDRSPRSSLSGSVDSHEEKKGPAEASFLDKSLSHDDVADDNSVLHHTLDSIPTPHEHTRLPRLSGMSAATGFSAGSATPQLAEADEMDPVDAADLTGGVSHMSHYEHEEDADAVAADTIPIGISSRRGSRAVFRSPSAVRALQMASPSSSVLFGTSPQSARQRRRQQSAMDGPDGWMAVSSPPRFRAVRPMPPPPPPPLVLLHATVLPTRWAWGDVLGERGGDEGDKEGDAHETDGLRRLRTAWCQLQARTGDTVAERGVLLPHPQDDYEVLEERLLEALELPVRRRARILECGHYLGPGMEDDDDEDDEGDKDDGRTYDEDAPQETFKRHWCGLCRAEIRYEPQSAERVFRVKVYASNGLMTAGAWAACWREMERVDVEIEPVVEAAVVPVLARLRETQREAEEQLREAEEQLREAEEQRRIKEAREEAREEERQEEERREKRREARREEERQEARRREEKEREGREREEREREEREKEERLREERRRESIEPEEVSDKIPQEISEEIPEVPEVPVQQETARDLHEPVQTVETVETAQPVLLVDPIEQPAKESTPPLVPPESTPVPEDGWRQEAAEARLREIYGRTPPTHTGMELERRRSDRRESRLSESEHRHIVAQPSEGDRRLGRYEGRYSEYADEGRSSEYAEHDRDQDRRTSDVRQPAGPGRPPVDDASLPALLMAAGRVILREHKHMAITLLSALVLVLVALRPVQTPVGMGMGMGMAPGHEAMSLSVVPAVQAVHAVQAVQAVQAAQQAAQQAAVQAAQQAAQVAAHAQAAVPAVVDKAVEMETVIRRQTVQVYETVTETATETVVAQGASTGEVALR